MSKILAQSRSPWVDGILAIVLFGLISGIISLAQTKTGLAAPMGRPEIVTQQKVVAADGSEKDGFGYSTAISDDGLTALIGTYYIEYGITYPLGPGSVSVLINEGGSWVFSSQLPTPDAAEGDEFGYSVAISADGTTALVGAKGGDVSGKENQGTAYVFTRSGSIWSQQAQLKASDGSAMDRFGISVALSDDGSTALVGAYIDDVGANIDQGSAYVFTRSGSIWSEQAHLTALDGAAGDYFGRSVSLSAGGSTALVGANMDKIGTNTKQGSAYIFTLSGGSWSQTGHLIAADGAAYDWFGASSAISGDGTTILIGAEGHTVGASFTQGAAYVFKLAEGSWGQVTQLTASDGESGDMFGNAVALSPDGSTAILAARQDFIGALMSGSAYLFRLTGGTWLQSSHLVASDGANNDNFGMSVALSGDGTAGLVGADYADVGGKTNQGAAYFFTLPKEKAMTIYLPLTLRQ